MAKLLYIEASPRKSRSHSATVARAFIDAYQEAHPGDEVETLDLWNIQMPEETGALPDLDEQLLTARYLLGSGQELSPEQQVAWDQVVRFVDHFKSADKYVFSLPMWNFSVPYKLKHFIDAITHPGLTFSFSPDTGYSGLVTGKPVTVVYARGGEYPGDAAAYDLQKRYMDQWLSFIGFTDIRSIIVEPTLNPSKVDEAKQNAISQAREGARRF